MVLLRGIIACKDLQTELNSQMPDDGKERERETVTLGEAAKVAAAACAFCNIGSWQMDLDRSDD